MSWQAERNKTAKELRRLADGEKPESLRLMVLAAHPDDETIGASALLARVPHSTVVYLTDGAPTDMKLWPPALDGSREQYAGLRRREAGAALEHAGVLERQLVWLDAIDQEAIFDLPRLVAKLTQFIKQFRPGILITHPYEGGHPDHDTAALVASLVVSGSSSPELFEMTSYHARDGQCITGEFLKPNPAKEIVFELTDRDRERKRKMMDAYPSQRLVLESFPILQERLRPAPEYNFRQPPHEGRLWYECMGWGITGAQWRELARSACDQTQGCSWR
jgi:N-acetylglucosamine malate deacetylase 2